MKKYNRLAFSQSYSQAVSKKKIAFTLAEVLITLGIIGVVAALTITPLVHKYKIKQYETAFKKVNANIQNAINLALVDYGYSNIAQIARLCRHEGNASVSATCREKSIAEMEVVWNNVLANLKVVPKPNVKKSSYKIKKVAGTIANASYYLDYGFSDYVLLNDGSAISSMPRIHLHQNGDYYYTFDTNGPTKGPNRIGYDIFIVSNRSNSCNINITYNYLLDTGSEFGCYNYALKNKSLDNKSKNYWESLK